MQADYSAARYLFPEIGGNTLEQITEAMRSFSLVENIYAAAVREVRTKLENLNDEFLVTHGRDLVYCIKARVKTPKSIVEKLKRRGLEVSIKSATENLNDIAGVRVVCSYLDDIYRIADLLTSQENIVLLRSVDYIKKPKPNGYRSLHLIVMVPVYLSKEPKSVKVEIQIRTIAMDFWASLEHDLVYKLAERKTEEIVRELRDCADVIAQTDARMQRLYNLIVSSELS